MRLLTLFLIMLASLAMAAPSEDKGSPEGSQKKSTQKSKSSRQAQQSLTGCVDEQDGNYVLLDDRMLNKLTDLEAVPASNEAFFAKHLGHKVTVKGSKSSDQDSKFKVTSIEDLAAVCAPAQGGNQE
jgi:maltose-binding protein MalE